MLVHSCWTQSSIYKASRLIFAKVGQHSCTLCHQVYLVSIWVKARGEWSSTLWGSSHFVSSIVVLHHRLWESFLVPHLVQMNSKTEWPPALWWLCPVWVADSLTIFLTSTSHLTQKHPISREHNSAIGMTPLEVNHMPHLRIEEISAAGQEFHLRNILNGIGGIIQSIIG